jgi:hypothetical protein
MTFEEQAILFHAHGGLIMGHGAGLSNGLFLPRRSVVIELYGYGLWCPIYFRALAAAGHHVFQIYSPMKGPNMDYAYTYGRPVDEGKYQKQVQSLVDRCERRGFVSNSLDGDCLVEARAASILVPIHEFEVTVLRAAASIGIYRAHKNASIYLMHGVPDDEEEIMSVTPLAHQQPNYYANRSWHLCPPQDQCCGRP